MNVDRGWRSVTLPKKIIRLIVKQFIVLLVGKFFSDDRDEHAMMHVAHMVVIDSWLGRPFMKWNFDSNSGLGPAGTLKGLIWSSFLCTSSQLCIDGVPARSIDVFWPKFGGANYLYELSEAFFGLLHSIIPVPVSKEKGRPVRIWIEKWGISAFGQVPGRVTAIPHRRRQS